MPIEQEFVFNELPLRRFHVPGGQKSSARNRVVESKANSSHPNQQFSTPVASNDSVAYELHILRVTTVRKGDLLQHFENHFED